MSELAYDITEGDWRVTGSYDEPDNIVFYHKGELFRKITYPGYRIWNIAAHFQDYLPEFEAELVATAALSPQPRPKPAAGTDADQPIKLPSAAEEE